MLDLNPETAAIAALTLAVAVTALAILRRKADERND